jgi:proteasome lid subunit RPN8/RPN11
MPGSCAVLSQHGDPNTGPVVRLGADLCRAFLDRALSIDAAGLKSYGVLAAEPDDPYTVTEFVFLDPTRNRRNDPGNREAFHAQGSYFRQFEDAGFVADPTELLDVHRRIDRAGRQVVAVFHTHRRQPANFSIIDYRLHNPAFPWHLIMSLRDPLQPLLQPFGIHKPFDDFGITPADDLDGSEQSYPGPEVRPLPLLVSGSRSQLRQLAAALNPAAA